MVGDRLTCHVCMELVAQDEQGIMVSSAPFACVQDRKDKNSFFNWFYLAINLGSLLAVTVVVYVQDSVGRPGT